RRLLGRSGYTQTLGNDDHVGRSFANLEGFLEQRRVEGSLEIETKERFGQSLAHLVKQPVEDFAELRVEAFAELLLGIAQALFEIFHYARPPPEQSDDHKEDAGAEKDSAGNIEPQNRRQRRDDKAQRREEAAGHCEFSY